MEFEKLPQRQPEGIEKIIKNILERGEIESIRDQGVEMGNPPNTLLFVKFKGDICGIFKSDEGTNLLKGKEYPFQGNREVAAYEVSQALGFDAVPITVKRVINGIEGSLQQFIPNTTTYYLSHLYKTFTEKEYRPPEIKIYDLDKNSLIALFLFDYIIFSADRHARNILIHRPTEKIYAIDNSLTFRKIPEALRGKTVESYVDAVRIKEIQDVVSAGNVPIPEKIRNSIREFLTNEERQKNLKETLLKYLSPEEVDACFKRIFIVGEFVKKRIIEKEDLLKMPYE